MSETRKSPCWYWEKGLHDAKLLDVSMQDNTLVLRIDGRNAMYDNFVEQIVFLDARLKTPLPAPTKKQPVYWLWDELTELPFEQWKLHIQLVRFEHPRGLARRGADAAGILPAGGTYELRVCFADVIYHSDRASHPFPPETAVL